MSSASQPNAARIDAYLHGLLEPAEAAEVERLAAASPDWQAALEAGRRQLAALQSLPQSEASEALIRRTLDGVERKVVRRRTWVRRYFGTLIAATVAGIALLVGMQTHYEGLSASPVDFRILGQNQLLAGSKGSLRIGLTKVNAGSGTPIGPIAGVPVQMFLVNTATKEQVRLADFPTDARGTAAPRFELPDWPSGQYTLKVVAQIEGEPEEVTQPVTLKRESKLMLSSDKPLYQPGQTIHLRALALRRPDLKPIGEKEALITIADSQGNVIFKHRGTTSRFGITSADCPLATEILEGQYQVTCRVGDTESQLSLQVEKYVLPKFKVALKLDKTYYQPGETVKGSVQADYFFGKPVAGGDVTLQVQATDIGTATIHGDTLQLDETGKADFEFELPQHFVGREQNRGDATIQVAVEVVDSASQKYAVAESRTVTTQPVRVEILPESGTLVKGIANKVFVLSTYADGRPAPATITVNSDQPFETNALGVGTFEITPESDAIAVVVTATTKDKQQGRNLRTLACGAAANDFLFRTDKAVYRGGDTIEVTTLGGGVQPVFLDLIKDKQTLLTQVIDSKDGKGETSIDLPADCFGTVELYAYRFDASGLPVMKTRTLYIEQPGDVKIAVERDADVYRPGSTAKLKFTLTDSSGKPAPGALSLAAVDEAVFHVLKQRPGLESTFFNLESELLEPVYAIYPWSPFVPGAGAAVDPEQLAQRIELERAIFSKTSRPVQATGLRAAGNPNLDMAQGIPAVGGQDFLEDFAPGMVEVMVDAPMRRPDISTDEAAQPVSSPLTLAVTTYPGKVQQVNLERQFGRQKVESGWKWFCGLLSLSLVLGFAVFKPRAFLITAGVMFVVGLFGFAAVFALSMTSPKFAATAKNAMPGAAADFLGIDEAKAEMAFAPMAEAMPGNDLAGGIGLGGIGADGGAPIRVRRNFPETLLWQPQLITDDAGQATLELPLADSITNWRLTASAVTGDGRLGALQDGVRVFQPFFVDLNLPVALTRNDEVGIPVVVYNYLAEPQTVEIVLESDEWFELLGGMGAGAVAESDVAIAELPEGIANPQAAKKPEGPLSVRVELKPNEIKALSFRLKATQVGTHSLQATARSVTQPGVADALRRDIAVEPDGRKVEVVQNGSLAQPAELAVTVPEEAIPGSAKVLVKLYPSSFSQLVEGLDAIFQMPYGCFEQTSSTTYPNILALDYLRQTKKSVPEVEAKARQYIHLGYQRLLSFEVTDAGMRGGFDWFGHPPANQTLSAYGLLEFTDMAKVHDVDRNLIERTRNWLLARRQPDGSWKADIGMLDDGLAGSIQRGKDLDLATTAYVAWAVFGGEGGTGGSSARAPQSAVTLNYLLAHEPSSIESPYVLAMVVNAVAAIDPQNAGLKHYVARLDALKKTDESGKKMWWEMPAESQTCFYSTGDSGHIEVTALATLALLATKQYPATAKNALTWLVEKKDSRGLWHSTQATILALKALIQGTTSPVGGEKERVIDVLVDGNVVQTLTIPADQADVMQQLNLSPKFASGTHTLKLVEKTDTGTGYQVTFRHHVPGSDFEAAGPGPLKIDIAYDKTKLAVNDFVTATATVTNTMAEAAPMVILDLPVPAGFRMATDTLDELLAGGQIAKYQPNARTTVVYLRALNPGETLTLSYRLEATMPVKLTIPAAVAYEYYNPAKRGSGKPIEMVVNPNEL